MDYRGIVIEESLEDSSVLWDLTIVSTKVSPVVEKHQTPWVKQWTMHTVEIPEAQVAVVAKRISQALDSKHAWYADFKNDTHHYIIFHDKVFFVDRTSQMQYDEAKQYGIALGIPDYQVDFHPDIKIWKQ